MIQHYTYPMKNTKNNMAAESISKAWLKGQVRILTKSAGGEEEQLRHIPDRVKDLNSAAQYIPREHGGAISDVFIAFTGEMSARCFQQGY